MQKLILSCWNQNIHFNQNIFRSSLLYGDLRHRSHMQQIVDGMPSSLSNTAAELRNILSRHLSVLNSKNNFFMLEGIFERLEHLERFPETENMCTFLKHNFFKIFIFTKDVFWNIFYVQLILNSCILFVV